MKRSDVIRLLSIFAWLGIGLIVLVVATTRLISVIEIRREIPMGMPNGAAPSQFIPPNEPLGELGSHCGGPLRLPCRPGLECSVDRGKTEVLGLCVQPQGVSEDVRQLGEVCDSSVPCAPQLVCASAENQSICKTAENDTPKITTFTLAGAQFDSGIYSVPAGSTIVVHATITNARTVTLWSRPNAGELRNLGTLSKSSNGYFRNFKLPVGFSGSVEVIADTPGLGFVVQSVRVHTLKK